MHGGKLFENLGGGGGQIEIKFVDENSFLSYPDTTEEICKTSYQ